MPSKPLATQIDDYLRGRQSPMAGLGSRFVEAGTKFGVDPRLLVGIGTIESGAGQHLAHPYSFANWGVHQGISYKNFGEAIDDLARGLYKGYISQGLTTPSTIVKRYAPGSDNNDEGNWANTVSSVMSQIGSGAGWDQRSPTRAATTPAAPPPTAPGVQQTAASMVGTIDPEETKRRLAIESLSSVAKGVKPTEALAKMTSGFMAAKKGQQLQPVNPMSQYTPVAALVTPPWQPNIPVVTNAPVDANTAGIVNLAKQYLGTPYSWGGGGPSGPTLGIEQGAHTVGFDCSGFIEFLWAKQGVAVGGTTFEQIKHGTSVRGQPMQPGDAIFFGTPDNPHHVGMYIGNGKYIQSPHTGDVVKISQLGDRSDIVDVRRYGTPQRGRTPTKSSNRRDHPYQ